MSLVCSSCKTVANECRLHGCASCKRWLLCEKCINTKGTKHSNCPNYLGIFGYLDPNRPDFNEFSNQGGGGGSEKNWGSGGGGKNWGSNPPTTQMGSGGKNWGSIPTPTPTTTNYQFPNPSQPSQRASLFSSLPPPSLFNQITPPQQQQQQQQQAWGGGSNSDLFQPKWTSSF